jgi:hypothetical protein
MSLLRPSIAGRLVRNARPVVYRSLPSNIRCESLAASREEAKSSRDDHLTAPQKSQPAHGAGESSMVTDPQAKEKLTKHNQPDYQTQVDHATS